MAEKTINSGCPEVRSEAAARFIDAAKGIRRNINCDIPVQQLMILAYIWQHGRASQIEMVKALDMQPAAMSRHCRSLSQYYDRKGTEPVLAGQGLIVGEKNIMDSRSTLYTLTERAESYMLEFFAELAGTKKNL